MDQDGDRGFTAGWRGPPPGNDTLEISLVGLPECGLGDAGGIFPGPGRYRLAVVASRGACTTAQGQPFPGPAFTVKPA
ncbi:MAG: hypothetical protein M3450_14605 [Actinomycetota bacterium]|nr:hypothetical protein [Actinomycetota bacterium]